MTNSVNLYIPQKCVSPKWLWRKGHTQISNKVPFDFGFFFPFELLRFSSLSFVLRVASNLIPLFLYRETDSFVAAGADGRRSITRTHTRRKASAKAARLVSSRSLSLARSQAQFVDYCSLLHALSCNRERRVLLERRKRKN